MAAVYPGGIKSFGADFVNGDTIPASCVNDLRAEVVALETALGVALKSARKTSYVMQVVDAATNVLVTHLVYFMIPQEWNGFNLVRATARVITAGTTNPTTIQVRNMTKYSSNDALSTAISIASAGTLATAGVVNASYDDVSTDDLIKIYVTGVSTTPPKGLVVSLEFGLP